MVRSKYFTVISCRPKEMPFPKQEKKTQKAHFKNLCKKEMWLHFLFLGACIDIYIHVSLRISWANSPLGSNFKIFGKYCSLYLMNFSFNYNIFTQFCFWALVMWFSFDDFGGFFLALILLFPLVSLATVYWDKIICLNNLIFCYFITFSLYTVDSL